METIVLEADAYAHFGRSPLAGSSGQWEPVLIVGNLTAQAIGMLLEAASPLTLRQNAPACAYTFEFWEVRSSAPGSVLFRLKPTLPNVEPFVLLPNHSLSGKMDS